MFKEKEVDYIINTTVDLGEWTDVKVKLMKLNKTQQKLFDALADHPERQEAFLAVIKANGRKWRQALNDQFLHDGNVCRVDDKYLPLIRQIRNDAHDFWLRY